MVKKLFKHEFLAWIRIVPLFFVIAPLAAAMYQLLGLFEIDNDIFDLIRGLAAITSFVALIPCVGAPIIFGVTRFYKNLFTGEGYLTFTLPVTTNQQLMVKVVVGGVFSIVAWVVAALSLTLFLAGEPLRAIAADLDMMLLFLPLELRTHLPLYIVEVILILCVGMFCSHLQYYSCICLGQLSKKNRILSAVAAYFLYYVITQVFSTVLSIAMLLLEDTPLMEAYYNFAEQNPYGIIHASMLFSLVMSLVLSVVFYLICHYVIQKKLNLE